MSDVLRLEGNGRSLDLYPWLNAKARGTEALAGILGFGLPGQNNQWFEGAGAGSSWRGARIPRRSMSIPMQVYAADRSDLTSELDGLAVALDPLMGNQSRLFFGMADNDEWFIDVVRSGGGDWKRKQDSDDRTFFRTTLGLEAGDPFWTRNRPESFEVRRDVSGAAPTLLPRLAKLRLASGAAFGVQEIENIGNTYAWAVFTITGPTTKVTLVGADGEILIWDSALDSLGPLETGDTLTIDMRANTVEDQLGNNRYDGLTTAPRFWSIRPGASQVTVQADNIEDTTSVYAQWWPRRWAVL